MGIVGGARSTKWAIAGFCTALDLAGSSAATALLRPDRRALHNLAAATHVIPSQQRSTTMIETTIPRPDSQRKIALGLALWGFAYACYRAYYAAGGTIGMIGEPVSDAQVRAINAWGAAIILFAAVLPLVTIRVNALRRAVPILGWIGAVGCCMHALVDSTLRVLSVTGIRPMQLPASLWRSFDRHAADLQDLLLNEPWFLVEGLLWAALALTFVTPAHRRAWLISAIAACLLLTADGILNGLDIISSSYIF